MVVTMRRPTVISLVYWIIPYALLWYDVVFVEGRWKMMNNRDLAQVFLVWFGLVLYTFARTYQG